MCCFSPVEPSSWLSGLFGGGRVHVSETSIFARRVGPATQGLAYAMKLDVKADVAMFLPLPTPVGAGEEALTFVDLSKHSGFFEELSELFVFPRTAARSVGASLDLSLQARYLPVHRVGSFIASFVPHRRDFTRLEPRFRLPDAVWDAVPGATDHGFAVFQLEPGAHHVHPMGLRFQTRDPSRLFFPTVHVHDGRYHPTERFDHALYFQSPRLDSGPLQPHLSLEFEGATASFLAPSKDYAGLVVPGQRVLRRTLHGRLPNQDTWVTP